MYLSLSETARPLLAFVVLAVSATASSAQTHPLPFAVGERLEYVARAPHGLKGKATMWVEGPETVRGVSTMVLRFDFSTRVGFVTIADHTTSWLDPVRFAAQRYDKREVRFMARHTEHVELEPGAQAWTEADGRTGKSPSSDPLDELSFIYWLRTASLEAGETRTLERHFDPARNPTVIRSLGRGRVTTPLGTFVTREVEMRVRDARNYQGEGVIRFSFSDDACRRPVRIESTIPEAGKVVMTLTSASPIVPGCMPATAAAANGTSGASGDVLAPL
jgi:hypothetical protein